MNRSAGASLGALSPTLRSTVRRGAKRARVDRRELYGVLDAALVCHLGVLVDGVPLVLPTAFGYDAAGPDDGGSLYLHGSVASRSLREVAPKNDTGQDICVTVTVVDGLVLARSAFHHSMNYRSAVVIGRGRLVEDAAERAHALQLIVDRLVPGRTATLRPHTRKELAATAVVALPLAEASVKARSGDPVDDQPDMLAGGWAGVLPVETVVGAPVTASDASGARVPAGVVARSGRSPRVLPGIPADRS